MEARRRILVVGLVCSACVTAAGCRPGTGSETKVSSAPPAALPDPAAPPRSERPAGTLPTFRAVGRESGLDFERFDDIGPLRRILEVNGGGAAVFDYDGDGQLDIAFTNGCRLPVRTDTRDTPSELFRNVGGMRFERVSAGSGFRQFGYAYGCAAGDYDADGFADLYITTLGRNTLWRNNGDGSFTDVTEATGTSVMSWSSSAAFAELNGDGALDLYVVNYLDESDESPRLCPAPEVSTGYASCPPTGFRGVDDALFLSDGAGGFVDATAESGIAGTRGKGLGVVVSDLDADGRAEIYVTNDGEPNFLFVPDNLSSAVPAAGPRPVRYAERAPLAGVALNEAGYAQASMGVAAGDYDADGTIDLFLTNFYDDTSTLYANRGDLLFQDATRAARLASPSRDRLGWGALLFDAENDGQLDLFVANGHIEDRTEARHPEPYRMRPQVFRNGHDGSFLDVSEWGGEYFRSEWLGRGAAAGDLDRDGRLDLVVSHQLAPSAALRNDTVAAGGSVVLRLHGVASNRDGYGARVTVVGASPPVVRELSGGGSFQSASAPEIHVGLAGREHVTVEIRWPSGAISNCPDLRAGVWSVTEGGGVTDVGRADESSSPKSPVFP